DRPGGPPPGAALVRGERPGGAALGGGRPARRLAGPARSGRAVAPLPSTVDARGAGAGRRRLVRHDRPRRGPGRLDRLSRYSDGCPAPAHGPLPSSTSCGGVVVPTAPSTRAPQTGHLLTMSSMTHILTQNGAARCGSPRVGVDPRDAPVAAALERDAVRRGRGRLELHVHLLGRTRADPGDRIAGTRRRPD